MRFDYIARFIVNANHGIVLRGLHIETSLAPCPGKRSFRKSSLAGEEEKEV